MFKIGDKAKGFKFDGDKYSSLGYSEDMDNTVGVVGVVTHVGDDSYSVKFGEEGFWGYPNELWHLGKVEEEVIPSFTVGDRVKFKKSSIDSGMIDATEDDVFNISHVAPSSKDVWIEEHLGYWGVGHFEHVKENIMNNTEEQEIKWEGSQIDWQVGQEVFCCVFGKGTVIEISKNGPYPLRVSFEYEENTDEGYTMEGKLFTAAENRTLFFSEPKIEAEKFPPKKLFVPTLKKGDVAFIKVVNKLFGEGTVRTIYDETEDRVFISNDWMYFLKKDIESLHILSEEIIFN